MKERDILRFEGPFGTFFLRDESDKPIVLVASGTGFAPIKALIEAAFKKRRRPPHEALLGRAPPEDLYLNALAERWASDHPGFEYVPVISDALPEDKWGGRTGFVHRAVMEDLSDLSATRSTLAVCRSWWIRAARLHPEMPAAGKRILRRFVHYGRRQGALARAAEA